MFNRAMEPDLYTIRHENNEISFTLKRSRRKSIAIRVFPDQRVEVTAPGFSSKRYIFKSVLKRASWIIKKQNEFAVLPAQPPEPEFKDGDKFGWLGRQFTLKVSTGKPRMEMTDEHIHMHSPAGSELNSRKKQLLEWYRKEGRKIFTERIRECTERASVIGINEIPEWNNKKMKKRWGSCTGANKVYFNLELVSAPVECIDYVILHELCHIIEHNHSRRYYSLLTQVCPDWKARRKYLNENVKIRIV